MLTTLVMPSFIFAGRNTKPTFARKPHEINDKCKRKLKRLDAIFQIEIMKMAFEMNDLKGILFLVLFAIPLITSANIDCSGKGFHCVNSTHFMICVDLGNGVSTTIDDFIIPCPPTTVCDKNNHFECDFPKIEVTTLAPLQVIGVFKQSDTSATTTVGYSGTTTTIRDDILGVLNENGAVTTLPMPEEVISEKQENYKQLTRIQKENLTDTGKNIQVISSTSSAIVIANDDKPNNSLIDRPSATYNNNIFALAPETLIDKVVTDILPDSTPVTLTDLTTTLPALAALDLLFNSSQTVTSTNKYFDVLNSINTSYENPQNNSEQNAIGENPTTVIPGIVSYLASNKFQFTSEPAKEVITEKKFVTFSDIPSVASTGTTFDMLPFLSKLHNNSTTMTDKITTVTNIDEKKITDKIIIPKEIIVGYISNIADEISTTPVVNADIRRDLYNQNHSVNINAVQKNPVGEITTTDEVPRADTKQFDKVSSISVKAENVLGLQITTEKTFNTLELIDLISNESQILADTSSNTLSFRNTSFSNNVVKNTNDRNKNVTDYTFPKGNSVITEEISTTQKNNTDTNSFYNDVINIQTNLNIQNDLAHQNYTNQISIYEVTTTEQIPENNTNKIDDVSQPVTLVAVFETTTEETFGTAEHIDLFSNDSQRVAYTRKPTSMLHNPAMTTAQYTTTPSNNTDGRYNVTDKLTIPTANSVIMDEEINITEATDAYTKNITEDVIKLNLSISNDSASQNYTELYSIGESDTTKQVPDNNTYSTNLILVHVISDMVQTTSNKIFVAAGLVDIISDDSQSVAKANPSNNTIHHNTSDPYTNKQIKNTNDKDNIVTNKLVTPNGNILAERSVIKAEISTTKKVNIKDTINMKPNLNIHNDSVPETLVLVPQTTTENTLYNSELDLSTNDSQSIVNTSPSYEILYVHNSTINEITNKENENLISELHVVADKIDTSSINTNIKSFQKVGINNNVNFNNLNDSVIQNFIEPTPIGDITERAPEVNTDLITSNLIVTISEPIVNVVDHHITTESTFVSSGLVDTISNDYQSGARLISFSDNTTTTIGQNITKQKTKYGDNITSQNEKIFSEIPPISGISTTTMANTHTASFNNDVMRNKTTFFDRSDRHNQEFKDQKSIGEITTAQVPKTNITYLTPAVMDFSSEPVVSFLATTANAFVTRPIKENKATSTSNDLSVNETFVKEKASTAHPYEPLILIYDNNTDSTIGVTDNSNKIYQQSNESLIETIIHTAGTNKSETLEALNYPPNVTTFNDNVLEHTSFLPSHTASFNNDVIRNKTTFIDRYNQDNQPFKDQKSIGEITSAQVPKTNITNFTPAVMDFSSEPVVSFLTTTANAFVTRPIKENKATSTSNDLSVNESFVKEKASTAHPYESLILIYDNNTDSTIGLTDNSNKIYQQSNESLIETIIHTAGTNITETLEALNYPQDVTTFNDIVLEHTSFLPSTVGNPLNEILTSSQNESTVHKMEEPKNELLVTSTGRTALSDETNINIEPDKVLNINTTPYDITWDAVTSITVENWTLKFDMLTNVTTNSENRVIISPHRSDSHTIVDHRSTEKSIVKDQEKSILNQLDHKGILNETVQNTDEETGTYPLETIEKLKSIKQKYNIPPAENVSNDLGELQKITQPQPLSTQQHTAGFISNIPLIVDMLSITMDSVPKIQQNIKEKVITNTVPMPNYKIVPSTSLPLDISHNRNTSADTNVNTTFTTTDNTIIINTLNITETVSEIAPLYITTAGYVGITNIGASNLKGSVDTVTKFSAIGHTEKVNRIETVHSDVKNRYNTKSVLNTYKDENIKTVSIPALTNSTANTQTNGTLNKSSSNTKLLLDLKNHNLSKPSLNDANYKQTLYTTELNFDSKITRAGESVTNQLNDFPENLRTFQYLTDQNLKETILSTSTQPSPIKYITTENFKFIISTEVPLRSTESKQTNPIKTEKYDVTDKTNDLIYTKEEHGKLPNLVAETTTLESELTLSRSVTPASSKKSPIEAYREETMNKTTDFIESSTQITTLNTKDTNMELSQESPFNYYKLMDTPTIKYDNLGTPPLQKREMTIEPVRNTYVYSPTTLPPYKKQTYVLTGTKDLPVNYMSTDIYKNAQSSTTTETILNSVTLPVSMAKSIVINGNKISGNLGVLTNKQVVLNNQPVINKTANNVNYHENRVNWTYSKINTQNDTIILKNDTEFDLLQREVKLGVKKILYPVNDFSTDEESTLKPSVLERDDLPSEALPIVQIYGKTTDIVDDGHTLVQTSPINLTETRIVTPKDITQPSDRLPNTDIDISTVKQVGTNFGNRTDTYNITNIKTNSTRSNIILSLLNNTFNSNLERHLVSTNHTVMTEIQSNLNKSDTQSNKTNYKLKLSGASMHNPNLTSIKLNAGNKDSITLNVSASLFNCSNHTRGKYSDKKDCRKFYICVGNLQPLIGTCPNNTVFSEINKQCTRNLSHCVRNNQFRCLYEGRFSDFFKDNIYYICVINRINSFVRYTLQCQNGYHLNKFTIKCENNVDISSQSASSISENSKINNDQSKPKSEGSEINITNDFECEDVGKFPHEKDCRKYYFCTKKKDVYRRKIKTCSSDEVFSEKKKKCVETDSSEC